MNPVYVWNCAFRRFLLKNGTFTIVFYYTWHYFPDYRQAEPDFIMEAIPYFNRYMFRSAVTLQNYLTQNMNNDQADTLITTLFRTNILSSIIICKFLTIYKSQFIRNITRHFLYIKKVLQFQTLTDPNFETTFQN